MSAIRKNTTPAMQAVRYAVLGILTVLFLLPFYVLVRNAFASNKLITAPRWQWLPDQWNFDNFAALFADDNVGMLPALLHSAIMSISQTTLTVLISLMAGYALARWTHRLSKVLGNARELGMVEIHSALLMAAADRTGDLRIGEG